jgi:hypothetical protein
MYYNIFSYGFLTKTQEAAPPIEDPLTVQQFPEDAKQSLTSKSGCISESIALKITFEIVRPPPIKNLNLSPIL